MTQVIDTQKMHPTPATSQFRGKISKIASNGVTLTNGDWNKDHLPSIISNTYKSETCLIKKAVPKLGRFKVELFANPRETYKGIREVLTIWNGKIVSREKV